MIYPDCRYRYFHFREHTENELALNQENIGLNTNNPIFF